MATPTRPTPATGHAMNPRLERMDRDEVRALQLRRLNRLLARLWATNPFYQRRWREAGLSPGDLGSLDALRGFPVIAKEDLLADQAEAPPYGARLGIDVRDVHEITLSSGTSGNTQEVHAHSV